MIVAFHSMCYYAESVDWPFHGPEIGQIDAINKILFRIAIPFFIFVSSYIFAYYSLNSSKYSNPAVFILKKGESLMVPYFLWGVIQMVLFPLYMSWRTLFFGNLQLWYLAMLFNLFFFAILVRPFWQTSRAVGDVSVLLLLVVTSITSAHFIPRTLPFNIKEGLWYFPLFYCGMLSAKYPKISSLFATSKWRSFLLLLVSFSLIICSSIFSLQKGGNVMNMVSFFAGITIAQIVFAICSNLSYDEHLSSIFELFSKSCMNIYIVHHIIIWIILDKTDFCRFADSYVCCSIAILFFVSLAGSALFAFMMIALNIKGRFYHFLGELF